MVNQYLYNKLSEITSKVYPDFIPMAVVYPAIMIELIELENELYKGGSDVTSQMWDVHIVSPTVEERNLLAIEVREKIEHKSDSNYYVDDCVLIDSSTGFNKDVEMYFTILSFEIRVKDHASYSEDAFDWDFEGTLTIGTLAGEGGDTEYGYRAGWGDDYGSIANFYTYYEYAGIYWVDSTNTLYVWGVDVDVIQIDGDNYVNGTYNALGYTTFPFATNPLTGATIAIKIKGTNMETWDYEGVMTAEVYDSIISGFFQIAGGVQYGSILPVSFINFIWTDGFNVNVSYKITYLKIGNVCYLENNASVFLSIDPIYTTYSIMNTGVIEFLDGTDYNIKIKI